MPDDITLKIKFEKSSEDKTVKYKRIDENH